MQKFFPPKPPLDLVTTKAVDALLTLYGRNGYPNMAVALVTHDLTTSETALAGNLNETGLQAILSSALHKLMLSEAANEDGPTSPAPNGDNLN